MKDYSILKMFRRILAMLLAVITILVIGNLPVNAAGFTDVKQTDWYYGYVNKLVELNITSGVGDNKFAPNRKITRAEFVTFLCVALGVKKAGSDSEPYYEDAKNHWAKGWIAAADENGLTNIPGKDQLFYPDSLITRQDACSMVCTALGLKPDRLCNNPYIDVDTNVNTGYPVTAYDEYLMTGTKVGEDRYFHPKSSLTRAEVAAVLVNVIEYKKDTKNYKYHKQIEFETQNYKYFKADNYNSWYNLVKDLPQELIFNRYGLSNLSNNITFYSYILPKYIDTYKMTVTRNEYINLIVDTGTKYINTLVNADYKDIDAFRINIAEVATDDLYYDDPEMCFTLIKNYTKNIEHTVDMVKNNTIKMEGSFFTSKGMIVSDNTLYGRTTLRGTIRYKYDECTNDNALMLGVVGTAMQDMSSLSDFKYHHYYKTWYEQDIAIYFVDYPTGPKVQSIKAISDVRKMK